MNFSELAEKRYSCRNLSDKKVSKELVNKILNTAIKAPTAVNAQPYKIFYMSTDEAKNNIRKVTKCTFGANEFIVVGYKEDGAWVRPFDKRNFADIDAGIIATFIMMQIEDLGLSTTWVGYFDAPLLKELCPEMKDYELIAIFPIGYAEENAQPSERHFIRKDKEEAVLTL